MKINFLALFLTAMLLAVPGQANVIIVEDGFTDGDRTDGADPLDVAWYKVPRDAVERGDLTLTVQNDDGAPGIGSGNALAVTHELTGQRRGMLANFPEVSLNVGNSISLAFDFRILNDPLTNSKEDFRFGLYNSNGTVVNSDQPNDDMAEDDVGYFIRASTGTETEWSYVKDRGVSSFVGGNDINQLLSDQQLGGINDNLSHSVKMTLTLTSASVLDVAFVMDEGLPGEISMIEDDQTLATGTTTFNEIAFSSHDDDIDYIIDNVRVEYSPIPEPATFALLGLGLALLPRRKSSRAEV